MNSFMDDPVSSDDHGAFEIYDKRSKGLGYIFGQNINGHPVDGLGQYRYFYNYGNGFKIRHEPSPTNSRLSNEPRKNITTKISKNLPIE